MVILYDRFNLPENIFEIIFSTTQQVIVSEALINYIKQNGSEINKTQMSYFATKLHDGKYETVMHDGPYKNKKVKLTYNKRQFYDRILTPLKTMGLISYDMYKKTYKLSDHFNNDMIRIGLLWKKELRKTPPLE
jgi:hypothetical protein